MAMIQDDDAGVLDEPESEPEATERADSAVPAEDTTETTEAESKPETAESGEEEPYSRRVQKRINQFTKKIRTLEQESQFWRDRVLALEEKAKARDSEAVARELSQSEQQLQAQFTAAREAKRKAIEEGDIDAQLKIEDQLLDLRDQLREKRAQAERLRQPAQESAEPASSRPAPAPSESPDLPEGTKQWLHQNPWFMAGQDPRAAEIARMLDVELQEEGYSPDDVEMYAELDRRLQAVLPRRTQQKLPEKKDSAAPARPLRSPVTGSSADGRNPTTPAASAKRLSQDDLRRMRSWGYDPNKERDRKIWLRRNENF